MKLDTKRETIHTAGGAIAAHINPELQLRRYVLACMLWEKNFYCDGADVTKGITEIIPRVDPEKVAQIAIEAREKMKLRHVPLFLMRECSRLASHKRIVSETLARVIQRPDELTEYLAIYWKDERKPLSAQSKKGLAEAFRKFNEYSLAKYNRDGAIKLRDVLFLCHAKPKDADQATLWKKLVAGELVTPDTWEVSLSETKGANKKDAWIRLLDEEKLGALALLRNLRNMQAADVPMSNIKTALSKMRTERVLPFRFISAARYAPKLESELEQAMYKCVADVARIPGKTILVIDISGSMGGMLSGKSEMSRYDAAAALAILARELCEEPVIYATAGNDFSGIHATSIVPARRGFALRDAIRAKSETLGGGGIFLTQCMNYIHEKEGTADRIIVFTDEQDIDKKLSPASANAFGKHNYLVNVATEKNGIGYGKWTHVDGFSEAILDYILASENVLQSQ